MAEAIIKNDPEYLAWARELSERYRRSQIKAAVSVNREMLMFYWRLGKDVSDLHAESRWGSGFFETLSRDLRKEVPDAKGFSPRNLRYMKRFYELFPRMGQFCNKLWQNCRPVKSCSRFRGVTSERLSTSATTIARRRSSISTRPWRMAGRGPCCSTSFPS